MLRQAFVIEQLLAVMLRQAFVTKHLSAAACKMLSERSDGLPQCYGNFLYTMLDEMSRSYLLIIDD